MLTYILSHRPDEFGLVLSEEGFIPIKHLLQALSAEPGWGFVRRYHLDQVAGLMSPPAFEVDGGADPRPDAGTGKAPPRPGGAPPCPALCRHPPQGPRPGVGGGAENAPGPGARPGRDPGAGEKAGAAPDPGPRTGHCPGPGRDPARHQLYGLRRGFVPGPGPAPGFSPTAAPAPGPGEAQTFDTPAHCSHARQLHPGPARDAASPRPNPGPKARRDEPDWKAGTRALRKQREKGEKGKGRKG